MLGGLWTRGGLRGRDLRAVRWSLYEALHGVWVSSWSLQLVLFVALCAVRSGQSLKGHTQADTRAAGHKH